jgi:N-sulfoglucosamine sulfohydrolase
MTLRHPLALFAGLALALAPFAAAAAAPARPNILFVLSDDHSYPFLSCYGDSNVRTPALDQLAAEGMKFHRFFTVAPQCVPSRAGYLTGRSAVAARMTRFSSPLPRDEITFLELLRSGGGYYTGIAGRTYHLDGSAAPPAPRWAGSWPSTACAPSSSGSTTCAPAPTCRPSSR